MRRQRLRGASPRGRGLLGLLVAAGLLGGYYLAGGRGPGPGDLFEPRHEPVPPLSRTGEEFRAAPATGPQTLIVLKTAYPACGEEEVRTVMAGIALAGLHQEELLDRYPGYTVEVFRPGQVVLRRVYDGPCPDALLYRTIGVQDGRVVVFSGRPGNLGPVLRDTGIPVDDLLPIDREKLNRGIVVQGEAEVWRVLEGLDID